MLLPAPIDNGGYPPLLGHYGRRIHRLMRGFDVSENGSMTELRRGQSPQKGHSPIKFISSGVLNLLTAINLQVLCGHSIYGAKNLLNGPCKFLLKILIVNPFYKDYVAMAIGYTVSRLE